MADFPIPSFLENQSVQEIHDRMIKQLPNDIDISEGGHPWNLTRPTAYHGAYFAEFVMVEAIKLIFPRYAEDYAEIMEAHAESRGIERKAATYSTGIIVITGNPGTEIPAGSAFSTASINGEPAVEFVTTNAVVIGESGTVQASIKAIEVGTIGNVPAQTIILKANRITGIKSVTNPVETTGGTEEESIENLQTRIVEFDESQGVSFVGSESDYKRWALEVDGTGDAIIIPAQDDSGLITIVLTDANGEPANETLREEVYNHIMKPDSPSLRLAPINGGNIQVVAPETVIITVSVTIETETGIQDLTSIKENLLKALKEYMMDATQDGEVRYSQIYSIVSRVEGVYDYKDLLLNGGTSNIPISIQQFPDIEEENLSIKAGVVV